jgi:hypothetical protein
MVLTMTLLSSLLSPAHAFDRLPAESEARGLVTAAKEFNAQRVRMIPAAMNADAGLDAIFAPAGTAGTIAAAPGSRGAKGTYTIDEKTSNKVKLGLVVDFGDLRIVATLQVARSGGNATLSFDGRATADGEPPQDIRTTASGTFTFDPATGSGTITYKVDGASRTETFSQTPSGMRMTLMGKPHVFTRAR